MNLDEALKSVAILGAGGKMGRGIAEIILLQMARLEAIELGAVNGTRRRLTLVETDEAAMDGLRNHLKTSLKKFAERNIIALKKWFEKNPRMISNEEMINAFVDGSLDMLYFSKECAAAKTAHLVFEAVFEDVDIKTAALLEAKGSGEQLFFTNTSSIPINILRKKTGLNKRLIGVHFFNPPATQKLIELISPEKGEGRQLILELSKRLNKVVVESADVAGFIGNGHFMREILFALRQVNELTKRIPFEEAVYLINRITHEYLVRPMGIFHLMDFVGIDICQKIMATMRSYMEDDSFQDPLIDQMVSLGFTGGMHPNGTIKNGFFSYENNKPTGIICLVTNSYRPLKEGTWVADIKKALGPLPKEWKSWKELSNDSHAQVKIEEYFHKLFEGKTPGSEVAIDFLMRSKEISEALVLSGVAQSKEDVNRVLMYGFYHLYGSDIAWFNLGAVLRSQI